MICKIILEKEMQKVHKKTHKPSRIENSGKGLESEKGENDNNNITKKKNNFHTGRVPSGVSSRVVYDSALISHASPICLESA